MVKTLHELSLLQSQIQSEEKKYIEAIHNHKTLEDVKLIYLKIKDLQRQSNILMQHANKIYKE